MYEGKAPLSARKQRTRVHTRKTERTKCECEILARLTLTHTQNPPFK